MISFIRGLVADTTENAVILENNGIGYEIFMTGSSIEQVSRIDGEVKIHTYFQVREDAMQLYGFLSKDDPAHKCQHQQTHDHPYCQHYSSSGTKHVIISFQINHNYYSRNQIEHIFLHICLELQPLS